MALKAELQKALKKHKVEFDEGATNAELEKLLAKAERAEVKADKEAEAGKEEKPATLNTADKPEKSEESEKPAKKEKEVEDESQLDSNGDEGKDTRAPDPVILGTLGPTNVPITYLGKKTINGREYNDVHCSDGCTYLLSDEDLSKQAKLVETKKSKE